MMIPRQMRNLGFRKIFPRSCTTTLLKVVTLKKINAKEESVRK